MILPHIVEMAREKLPEASEFPGVEYLVPIQYSDEPIISSIDTGSYPLISAKITYHRHIVAFEKRLNTSGRWVWVYRPK